MQKKNNAIIIEQLYTLGRLLKSQIGYTGKVSQLTFLQIEALFVLKINKNVSMKQLSENFHITMPTATVLVDKLLEMKLVTRKNDTKDRRVVYISLTSKGEKLLGEGMKKREERMKYLLETITESEEATLVAILQKMTEQAQKMYEK